jgi:single-strand DNA-binding protein
LLRIAKEKENSMKDVNNFCCTCFCSADPELKEVGGTSLCTSRVGVNRIKEGDVDWFYVKVWGKAAGIFKEYVKKGSKLILIGRVHIETNNERVYPTIYVEDFKFVGGGKKKEANEETESDDELQPVATDGGIADDDIPF